MKTRFELVVMPPILVCGRLFAESFNATIKKELIHLHTWPTLDKVKREVFKYIEIYYNRQAA